MTDDPTAQSVSDPGLRLMMKWVFIALIAVLALAIVVVETMLRWFGP
jgi:hypothetical protein